MQFYDLEGVDDQHPHDKSVGKCVMANRVKVKDELPYRRQ